MGSQGLADGQALVAEAQGMGRVPLALCLAACQLPDLTAAYTCMHCDAFCHPNQLPAACHILACHQHASQLCEYNMLCLQNATPGMATEATRHNELSSIVCSQCFKIARCLG